MVILSVTIKAKPEKAEELKKLLSGFPKLAAAEPGCVQYEFFAAKDKPDTFFFFEKWADESTYQTHRQVPYLTAFRARAAELLAEPNQVVFLTQTHN